MSTLYDVAIIGGGGAGQMAILRAVLNNLNTLAFLGDAKTIRRSRHTWVHEVENIPGMFDKKRPITSTSKEVLDFIASRETLKKKLTTFKQAVTQIQKNEDGFTLKTSDQTYQARYVVLCTGTSDVQPHIQGSIDPIFPYANRGDILYCIRCDGHKTIGKTCAVIGHSDSAGWIAIMLKERYDLPKISILTNGESFQAAEKVQTLLKQYAIPISSGEIDKIIGNPKTGLEGFQIGSEKISAQSAFVALGSIVYNTLAKQLNVQLDHRDHLITDAKGQTSVEGFYAAGDLVSGKKKQVYTAWDMAVDAVDAIDEKIRREKRKDH